MRLTMGELYSHACIEELRRGKEGRRGRRSKEGGESGLFTLTIFASNVAHWLFSCCFSSLSLLTSCCDEDIGPCSSDTWASSLVVSDLS